MFSSLAATNAKEQPHVGFISSINKPPGGIVHAFDQPLEPVKQESPSIGKAFKAGAGIAALPDGVDLPSGAGQASPLSFDPKTASAEELQANLPRYLDEAKARLGELGLDPRNIDLGSIDQLAIPDWAKEAVKFVRDPEQYIQEKIRATIDENTPDEIKQGVDFIKRAARGIGAFLNGVGDVGEAVGAGVVSAGKGIVNGVKRFFGGLFD